MNDAEFLKKLLAIFKIEAEEHINNMSTGLLTLEQNHDAEEQERTIEIIFRDAHSLKGASRTVNMADIGEICQSLESIFSALKNKEMKTSSTLFDTLHNTLDNISKYLASPEGEIDLRVKETINQLESFLSGEVAQPAKTINESPSDKQKLTSKEDVISEIQKPHSETKDTTQADEAASRIDLPKVSEKTTLKDTVRISISKLQSILLQSEELLSVKMIAGQRAEELRNLKEIFDTWENEWKKFRLTDYGIKNMKSNGPGPNGPSSRLREFLDWNQECMKSNGSKISELAKLSDNYYRLIGGMVDNLLEDTKSVMMLPFSSLLDIFPKMVRDISKNLGKEVSLELKGGEIEIDRRILDEMKDPLIHLIRNCIDHGIEKSEERTKKNKPQRGIISIDISQVSGGNVEILVKDDGAGIDPDKVKEVALKRKRVSIQEIEIMNEQEVLSLIFKSDVSTSPLITDLSGRGLGLSIVKENVEKLGGGVIVKNNPQNGSTFQIILPLTVAIFRGILVDVSDQLFVVPVSTVECVARIKQEMIKTVENKETILLNGSVISFIRLNDVLELPRKRSTTVKDGPQGSKDNGHTFIPIIVLVVAEKHIAFSVDKIIGEQEVLVKSLGKQLSRIRNIANATVIGSGRVVPILNVHDLIKTATKISVEYLHHETGPEMKTDNEEEIETKRKSILVAEDSITARMLLKNILETAGYDVKTAVDGVDAFTLLKEGGFDLVVSDVEMPRMNGFDLTSKIRDDKKYSETPVILVTALKSREHKERGIDVGANAYIIKSSFDQSDLLNVIRRLI